MRNPNYTKDATITELRVALMQFIEAEECKSTWGIKRSELRKAAVKNGRRVMAEFLGEEVEK